MSDYNQLTQDYENLFNLHQKTKAERDALVKTCCEAGIGAYKGDYYLGKLTETGKLRQERNTALANDWTASLIDRLNEFARENAARYSEVSSGSEATALIQQIHGGYNQLRIERDAALAKVAEMSGILEDFKPICSEDPEDMARINHALSSDCGKGWVHVSRVAPLVEALNRMLTWSTMLRALAMDSATRGLHITETTEAEQALAEWKKATDSQTTFANAVDKPPSAV